MYAIRSYYVRGVVRWNLDAEYNHRFTEAYRHLRNLDREVELLKKRYASFVRTRQAATQSYDGYDDVIRGQRSRIQAARETLGELMARQGHLLETMAVNVLTERRERLAGFRVKARFGMADSYDRAARAQTREMGE